MNKCKVVIVISIRVVRVKVVKFNLVKEMKEGFFKYVVFDLIFKEK